MSEPDRTLLEARDSIRHRRARWAITINGPWRLCFRFKDGHAFDVEIVDYH